QRWVGGDGSRQRAGLLVLRRRSAMTEGWLGGDWFLVGDGVTTLGWACPSHGGKAAASAGKVMVTVVLGMWRCSRWRCPPLPAVVK
ncbi:hypothetical protein Dimus_016070, partial [Dionaea muscipula]